MKTFNNLYLAWRMGRGYSRQVVGVVKKKEDADGFYFKYLITQEEAAQIGFVPYAAFSDFSKIYTENVLDIFGLRLTRSERSDIQKYYDFWEIEPQYRNDKWYLLAHTQGLLATDNFEFLADYYPSKKLSFISEVCGISHHGIFPEIFTGCDMLQWQYESQNKHDKYAVKVFKDDVFLGYVKKIHSKVFYKKGGESLKIQVKSIDKNGRVNRIFVKIYMPVR
ncbi:MAG: hypothetical protein LBC02_00700 [Planctomycetaceae bacterium]|jgi:hypothetical protein|nr:hypothetical protein [Planctomycetaceae bacterium]